MFEDQQLQVSYINPYTGGTKRRTGARPEHMPNLAHDAEALHEQREWLRVTLASIGDAVITTDTSGKVTFLNPVAQTLTGWTQDEAAGVALETVFRIINEDSRRTVENPAIRALREGVVVGLANHTLLISKDGTERPIDDSAAPIRNAKDEVAGVVLVFRDVTERRAQEHSLRDALAYAESIIATLREPFIVLTKDLRVKSANRCFYEVFHTTAEEIEQRPLYEIDARQWDIPELRSMLEKVQSQPQPVLNFEVTQTFLDIGQKIMLLNGLHLQQPGDHSELILLAIEDVTERRWAETELVNSELRYRRLFETAQDAILILDAKTGKITDANPYIKQMLGYTQTEFVGKQLWEIGLFQDIQANQRAFRELQEHGYIRYEHLPLETKTGQPVEVEFVSNVYEVDHQQVIQCNIRDITERARLERQVHEHAAALADLHRRKDEFMAMLSHELRNPLSPLLNAVQILRLQKDGNQLQQQARAVVERQVNQLSHLVNDLLEVSRVITGRIQLQLQPLDLRGVVEAALDSARPLIEQRRHELP
jgi:PAS domain S-box-containing protein